MNQNSTDFVAIAKHMCPVCGKTHTHNSEILLHKQLKSIPQDIVTEYGLCEEDQAKFDDGYVALIEVDNEHTNNPKQDKLKLENANRIGTITHIRRHVLDQIINSPIPEDQELMFIDAEAMIKIQQILEGNIPNE